MKSVFVLSLLFVSISILILQSNSFTTAEVRNDASISMASEGSGLIAINGHGKRFAITNNMDKTIDIDRVELVDESEEEIINMEVVVSNIFPGEMKEFTLTGDSKDLAGKVIQIIVRWEGGNAEIQSKLPEFPEEIEEPSSDITEELATPKPEEDQVEPEVIGDIVTELTDEPIIPESEESITTEHTEEQ